MTATVIPFDRSPLTPADEALMTTVAGTLERQGFSVTRETVWGHDRYVIRLPWTVHPIWTIGRRHSGLYQLQNGFGLVLRSGRALEEALLPGWVPSSSAAC